MGNLTSGTESLMMERERRLSEMMGRKAELAEIFKNAAAEHEEECRDLSIEETRDRTYIYSETYESWTGTNMLCYNIEILN